MTARNPGEWALIRTFACSRCTRGGYASRNRSSSPRPVRRPPDGWHDLIICTLCSCFPWPVLGLPPYWYKDPVFRSRAAREPRRVLAESGVDLPEDTDIKVWDSSGHSRWFVIPERPAGTENFTDDALMELVTTESIKGVGPAGAAT